MNAHTTFIISSRCSVPSLAKFRTNNFRPVAFGEISGQKFLYGISTKSPATDMFSRIERETCLLKMAEEISKLCGSEQPFIEEFEIPEGEGEQDESWCSGTTKEIVSRINVGFGTMTVL
ncbi:hypothetical protein MarSH_464 [Marseillevirus Shanghai 1]|nr:hypothetical protein MEL_396 [Melbournevirus]AIT55009.1 hypothetical protein MEL_396 [Melbournevirus]AVR53169.1 hypothetical protein MarSH_464 [Marseillevirus Shanghai 1]